MAIPSIAMQAYTSALNTGRLLDKPIQTGKDNNSFEKALGAVEKAGNTSISNTGVQSQSFMNTVQDSLGKVNELQQEKANMINSFASGDNQNVHELMISLQKAGMAMSMTSAVRNKVLDSYKELMKMQF